MATNDKPANTETMGTIATVLGKDCRPQQAILQGCNWAVQRGIKLAEKVTAATRLGMWRMLLK